MKYIYITTTLLLFTSLVFSQNFSFSKIFYQEQIRKLKGTIKLTDTSISITSNGSTDTYEIREVYQMNNIKQFKGNGHGEDVFVRITLNNPENPTKQHQKTLLYETKDTFSNTYTKILYYLKEND